MDLMGAMSAYKKFKAFSITFSRFILLQGYDTSFYTITLMVSAKAKKSKSFAATDEKRVSTHVDAHKYINVHMYI